MSLGTLFLLYHWDKAIFLSTTQFQISSRRFNFLTMKEIVCAQEHYPTNFRTENRFWGWWAQLQIIFRLLQKKCLHQVNTLYRTTILGGSIRTFWPCLCLTPGILPMKHFWERAISVQGYNRAPIQPFAVLWRGNRWGFLEDFNHV